MELEEFVQKTLKSIAAGIIAARESQYGEGIAPDFDNSLSTAGPQLFRTASDEIAYPVNFDLAVTVSEDGVKEGAGSIKVWPVTVGGNFQKSTQETQVSRVSFLVPFAIPRKAARKVPPAVPFKQRNVV